MCNPSTLVYDASVGMCVNLTDAKSDACRKYVKNIYLLNKLQSTNLAKLNNDFLYNFFKRY